MMALVVDCMGKKCHYSFNQLARLQIVRIVTATWLTALPVILDTHMKILWIVTVRNINNQLSTCVAQSAEWWISDLDVTGLHLPAPQDIYVCAIG